MDKSLSLTVPFTAITTVSAVGRTGLGLGEHLCDQACQRHCVRGIADDGVVYPPPSSQEQQKSRAYTVICLWHKIRASQLDH